MPLADTILLMMGLLAIAMVALALTRNLPIPYTVFLVLIGMLLHQGGEHVEALAPLAGVELTPDLVFFVFLPALIFESALNLDARQLLKDIAPVLALAIPALLISIAIIGLGIAFLLDTPLPLALTFGALIAATDPVAVIALFKELGAPNRLTVLVEGESLFNDATAIVVFHILLGIVLAGEFSAADLPHALGDFLRVFFGGVLVGAVVGFGISEIMRRIESSSLALVVMTLVMAYASFVLAEHTLHVSGVMAALSAAIAMGLYAVTRIPQAATRLIHETWEVISLIANSLLFLMIGLTVDLGNLAASGGAILLAALLVIIGRAAAVYSLVPVTTRMFRLPTVSMGERHIMWWGGLKGGLAIAIVLSIPQDLAGRDFLVTLTLGVVMFTLLVNAPTIRPLIARLGIDRLTMDEQIETNRAFVEAGRHSAEALQRFRAAGLLATGRVDALQHAVQSAIDSGDSEAPPPQLRTTYLEAFRIERSELDVLFEIGMIHEYTYLDMLASLRRRRDSWSEQPGDADPETGESPNPFQRIERAMLRRMREQNLLAGLLARYQRLRFGQRLQRDIAGIMTSVRVIGLLPTRPGLDPDHVETVLAGYRTGLERKRERVAQIARDFPVFYQRFEERFFETAAVTSALHRAESAHEGGDLGAKAYQRVRRALAGALEAMPELVNPTQELGVLALIDSVPLFSGLAQATQQRLADLARTVSFLPGDEVIGQDQRGNALYIITQGSVGVYKHESGAHGGDGDRIAALGSGDFFGETALLGDDVRTATVRAETPLVLLRLTRRAVDELAREDQTIAARLSAARDARR